MPATRDSKRTIFFAAFEPSGDALAARLIEELARRDPSLAFTGYGGPKMQAAGAALVQQTTEHAVAMGHGFLGEVKTHLKRCRAMSKYLKTNDIAAFVPVDSPAANWALCKRVREHRPKAKIVHLVCPQVWSWAQWRVRRLRRLSDRVLCLLPFEPDWLSRHGVPATFVGHPVFEDAPAVLAQPVADDLPTSQHADAVRLALMPGSRKSELVSNWPTMLAAYREALSANPHLIGVVAARVERDAALLREQVGDDDWPESLSVVPGRTEAVLRWADAALVKSGTSTLQVASLRRPMVSFYNIDPLKWHAAGRWLVNTRTFTLPNIISEWQDDRRVIPEFVPHFADPEPIAAELTRLVTDPQARERQIEGLSRICEPFSTVRFKEAAAAAIIEMLGG